ncbi:unnamed protein product [Phytophthora lilii]|uniref:Unnamed protein product n=1 Tax=Phytophthora lilii TaxID=2077276 RepID=A0A9W6WK89_9STRA|nr:unnamed protein product [Phytophthora lilii]
MADFELVAVYSFLNELSLDDIFKIDSIRSNESVCSEVSSLDDDEMVDVVAMAGVTSDESSDSDDLLVHRVVTCPGTRRSPKTEAQRVRQRMYDKKCRSNKTVSRNYIAVFRSHLLTIPCCLQTKFKATCEAFVPVLNEFVRLIQLRLKLTESEIQQLRLVKSNAAATEDATSQLIELNAGATKCIKDCVAKWEERKKESGRFFLRHYAEDIEEHLETLEALEKRLSVATAELLWRTGKATVPWV